MIVLTEENKNDLILGLDFQIGLTRMLVKSYANNSSRLSSSFYNGAIEKLDRLTQLKQSIAGV